MTFSLNKASGAASIAAVITLVWGLTGIQVTAEPFFSRAALFLSLSVIALVSYRSTVRCDLCADRLYLTFGGSDVRIAIALSTVIAFVALKRLPAPGVWIAFVFALLLGWLVYRRKRFRYLLYNTAVVVITLGAVEGYCWLSTPAQFAEYKVLGELGGDYVRRDKVLGVGPNPDVRVAATKRNSDGSMIYNVVYTMDKKGLRVTPNNETAGKSALFFGCSYMFGEGLDDLESMPYRASTQLKDYQVYNFAFHGYGPHHMLAEIETGRVDKIVTAAPRHVIFQLLVDHVRRVAGRTPYSWHDPKYELVDGRVVARGHFDDDHLIFSLYSILRKSKLYVRFVEPRIRERDIVLTVEILKAARDFVIDKYCGCSFDILFWDEPEGTCITERKSAGHDSSRVSNELVALMRQRGLRVHCMSDILPNYVTQPQDYRLSAEDRHPNAAAQRLIAEYVTKEIILRQDKTCR